MVLDLPCCFHCTPPFGGADCSKPRCSMWTMVYFFRRHTYDDVQPEGFYSVGQLFHACDSPVYAGRGDYG